MKTELFENAILTGSLMTAVRFSFYDNCRDSRALIGEILWSICGQTYEFENRATRQQTTTGNSIICYRKKQIDVSF